ncbi:MAG: 4-(cytidine 5'-diphospho)-2-C-methyl-D-erythritol kinase [Saccharofermentans sp.]|nr:4-(cytidine 5'-diphospho)-2-C-methyl-D-erythritol kinase [Saccharofermentans sp.]
MHTYKTTAYAKINLFLRVCGVLEGGYHQLYMLMQEIGLGDDIAVELDDSRDFDIDVEVGLGWNKEDDLCYKAAKAFYEAYGQSENLPYTSIKTTKNVPSQAGLGGGSSDAASVLMVLQNHFEQPLSEDKLKEIAKKLGADVPFFLAGGTSICEGIGEIIRPLPSLEGTHIILVKPEVGVPTGKCFKMSDETPQLFDYYEYKSSLEEIYNDEKLTPEERIKKASGLMTNDLQIPAEVLVPEIKSINDAIKETGAIFNSMSGSGSCSFGIYDNEEAQEKALELLRNDPRTSSCSIIPTILI